MYIAIALSIVALVVSVLALLVAIGVALRSQSRSEGQLGIAPGSRVPEDTLRRLFGPRWVHDSLNSGAIVVLVSSDCQPCRQLIDLLNERGSGFLGMPLMIIETGREDDTGLRERASFDATWAMDPEGLATSAFETPVTPHLFIVRDGLVQDRLVGNDLSQLEAKAKAVLGTRVQAAR